MANFKDKSIEFLEKLRELSEQEESSKKKLLDKLKNSGYTKTGKPRISRELRDEVEEFTYKHRNSPTIKSPNRIDTSRSLLKEAIEKDSNYRPKPEYTTETGMRVKGKQPSALDRAFSDIQKKVTANKKGNYDKSIGGFKKSLIEDQYDTSPKNFFKRIIKDEKGSAGSNYKKPKKVVENMEDNILKKIYEDLKAAMGEKEAEKQIKSVSSTPIEDRYGVKVKPGSKEEEFIKKYKKKSLAGGKMDLGDEVRGLARETEQIADDLPVYEQFKELADADDAEDTFKRYMDFTEEASKKAGKQLGPEDLKPVKQMPGTVASQMERELTGEASKKLSPYIKKVTGELDKSIIPHAGGGGGGVFDDILASFRRVPKRPLAKALAGTAGGLAGAAAAEIALPEDLNVDADYRPQATTAESNISNIEDLNTAGMTDVEILSNMSGPIDEDKLYEKLLADRLASYDFPPQKDDGTGNYEAMAEEVRRKAKYIAEKSKQTPTDKDPFVSNMSIDPKLKAKSQQMYPEEVGRAEIAKAGTDVLGLLNEANYRMDPLQSSEYDEESQWEDVADEPAGDALADKSDKSSDWTSRRRGLASLYEKGLAQARGAESEQNLMNALLRAGIQAGAGIAGIKADYSGVDALDKTKRDFEGDYTKSLALEKESEKEEKRLQKEDLLRNPPDAIKPLLEKYGAGMTLEMLDKLGVNTSQLLAAQYRDEIEKKKIEAQTAKDDKKKDSFLIKQQNDFLDKRKRELNKLYDTMQTSQKNVRAIKTVLADIEAGERPGPRDVELLFKFIKAFDPESVVRESEIALAKSATSFMEGLKVWTKNKLKGALLSPDFRKAVLSAAEVAAELEGDHFKKQKASGFDMANRLGIEPGEYNKLVFGDVDLGTFAGYGKQSKDSKSQMTTAEAKEKYQGRTFSQADLEKVAGDDIEKQKKYRDFWTGLGMKEAK